MHIKKIIRQNRRDFTAIYQCEHCNVTEEAYGYDDAHFHRNVIPAKKCPSCGLTANNDTFRPLGTKYPEWQTV